MMESQKRSVRLIVSATAVFSALALGGCMSDNPRPDADIAQAKTVLDQAERNGTRDFAAFDLNDAKTKLKEADRMMAKGEMKKARYLSEEAKVEAELAMAKARTAKSKEAEKELDQSMQSLQNEVNKTGAPQE